MVRYLNINTGNSRVSPDNSTNSTSSWQLLKRQCFAHLAKLIQITDNRQKILLCPSYMCLNAAATMCVCYISFFSKSPRQQPLLLSSFSWELARDLSFLIFDRDHFGTVTPLLLLAQSLYRNRSLFFIGDVSVWLSVFSKGYWTVFLLLKLSFWDTWEH